MSHLTMMDVASREGPRVAKKWQPGGHKGKLHRELGIPEGQKISAGRLTAAEHSSNREVRDDAIRAKTMEGWKHGSEKRKKQLSSAYNHPTTKR
jgi:hypothetical protein